jgi:hypothetical protein
VAVNVTDAPAHIGFDPAVMAIAIDGTNTGFTVMVIPALVAVVGLAQVALEVSIHVTTCPLVKVVVVNVGLLVPALMPLTFH